MVGWQFEWTTALMILGPLVAMVLRFYTRARANLKLIVGAMLSQKAR
jgi:hypothetical protein